MLNHLPYRQDATKWDKHKHYRGMPSMPMFYFHQQDSSGVTEDPEGSELPDLPTARAYAVACAREALANAIRFNASG
jgi:hypothetical protein